MRNKYVTTSRYMSLANFKARLVSRTISVFDSDYEITHSEKSLTIWIVKHLGLALLTLSWDKNWDSHSLVNGYPSFYPRIALIAPSPG